jgi:hypothetical protein
MLTEPAKIYVNDAFVGESDADHMVALEIQGGQPQRLRFVNEALQIDTTKTFVVEPAATTKALIELSPRATNKGKK